MSHTFQAGDLVRWRNYMRDSWGVVLAMQPDGNVLVRGGWLCDTDWMKCANDEERCGSDLRRDIRTEEYSTEGLFLIRATTH